MYQLTTLPNGMRVASELLPGVESVSVSVSTDVGARYESKAEHGISHLLEHMAFKGTKRRSARQIAEEFDNIGGAFNAYTSMEHTVYYAKVLKDSLPLAVDILSDILLNSVFSQEELERERGVICQEIAMHQDAPDDLIFDYFDEAAYPDQPVGRTILGTPERIRSHSREDLISYMSRHYVPSRMVLSAAGNVNHDSLVSLAQNCFPMPQAGMGERPEPAAYVGGDARVADDLEQLHLLLGFPALSVHHDDYYALQLYSMMLGGGMSSRLFQEVREKRGLAYHVSSMVSAYSDGGMLSMYSATGAEQSKELPLILIDEVKKMCDGVTDAEFSRVKNQQKAELLMAKESPGTVAGWIGKHLLIFGRYRDLQEITARVESVGKADVQRVAERIASGTPTMTGLGPIDNLPNYAEVKKRLAA